MKLPVNVKDVTEPISKFYIQHESTILMSGSIGFSILSTAAAVKNSRRILNTIDDAKKIISNSNNNDEIFNIYKATVKELAPLISQIVIFQALSIACTVRMKRCYDKKLSSATEALTIANSAIMSYKAFKEEAEKTLSDSQKTQVNESVAKKVVSETPQTEHNTVPSVIPHNVNNVYKYLDPFRSDCGYFYSTMSPSAWRERIHRLSIKLCKGEINNYDSEGRATVTYNDIYRLLPEGESLVMHPAGDTWGYYDNECGSTSIDEDLINVDISPAEDPNDPDQFIWYVQMNGGPLFRSRY